MMRTALLLFVFSQAYGFVPLPAQTRVRMITTPIRVFSNDSFEEKEHSLEELDRARALFEHLMYEQGGEAAQLVQEHHHEAPPPPGFPVSPADYIPPPLTESSRRRRQAEMELIKSLEDSDEAIDEIMTFWLVERDAESAMRLRDMALVCSPHMEHEEMVLRTMVEHYGSEWVEPISRLAALLYFKGDTQESEYWCRIALAIKPWHFEVMQTLTFNALHKKDFVGALHWRRMALPPLNPRNDNKKRKEWVKLSLSLAQKSFNKAETAAKALKTDFTEPSGAGDAWQ